MRKLDIWVVRMFKFNKKFIHMNANRHLLLVVNPKSGSGDKSLHAQMLAKIITEKGWTYEIYETTGQNDADAILKAIKIGQPERIIIVGGDGTINLVAHALKDAPLPFGIIPAGSANGLAHNLQLPEELEEQIAVAIGDHFVDVDHLNINGHSCLHIADLGLNAELIHNFEDAGIRGKLGYLLQTVPTLINSEGPFTFNIEIEGKSIEHSGILLAIANAKDYGTGATINPNGNMNDGKFEVMIFKDLNPMEIAKTIYDEVDLTNDFAEEYSTTKVRITSKKLVPFQIDGEAMGKTNEVIASIYPKKLSFAVAP